MKILMVSAFLPQYHNTWGGAERETCKIAGLLKAMGEEVSFFCSSPHIKNKPAESGVYFAPENRPAPALLKPLSREYSYYSLAGNPSALKSFSSLISQLKPHVIHFHNFMPLPAGLIIEAKKQGIPAVLTIYDYRYLCVKETLYNDFHNCICKDISGDSCIDCVGFKRFKTVRKALFKHRRNFFTKILNTADHITVLSNSSAEIMRNADIPDDKISIIPPSFDFKESDESIPTEQGLVLFVGWIQPRKGISVVLEAFKIVLEKVPDAKLLVFGGSDDPTYLNKIQDTVLEEPLKGRVTLMGKRPYDEVREYMKKAAAVVIAEQWPNMSPLTLIEAMAYKRPVTASNIGGIPEFIQHGESGFLSKHDDPKDFAKYLLEILQNPQKAQQMGENAGQSIRRLLNIDNISKKYHDIYIKLCELRQHD